MSVTVGGMPSMITKGAKEALRAFGFTPEAVAQMTPLEALKTVRTYELVSRSLGDPSNYNEILAWLIREAEGGP